MNVFLTWISVTVTMIFVAAIWFSYLVRVVLNEELVQERKRRRNRARELERRRMDDKIAARKKRRGG